MAASDPSTLRQAQGSGAGSDLEVLHPERELQINGETLTVREFSFVDGLTIEVYAAPLIKALDEAFAADQEVSLETLAAIFSACANQVLTMLARSTGRDEAWVRGLKDADGQLLLMTFWATNAGFFGRRLGARRVARAHLKQAQESQALRQAQVLRQAQQASAASTPSSSVQDTASPKSSDIPDAS